MDTERLSVFYFGLRLLKWSTFEAGKWHVWVIADSKRRNIQELARGQESIDPLLQVASCPAQIIQRVSQHWRMLQDVIFVGLRDVVLLAQNFRAMASVSRKHLSHWHHNSKASKSLTSNFSPDLLAHLMEGKASRSSGGSTASTGCNARNASTSSSWVNGQTHVWLSHWSLWSWWFNISTLSEWNADWGENQGFQAM